jgi:hypothetical protein
LGIGLTPDYLSGYDSDPAGIVNNKLFVRETPVDKIGQKGNNR